MLLRKPVHSREIALRREKLVYERGFIALEVRCDCGRTHDLDSLKGEFGLDVAPVWFCRANCRKRLVDVIAAKKVAISEFQDSLWRKGVGADQIDLGADVAAVTRIDSVGIPGGGGERSATSSGHRVQTIMCVRQPERVRFAKDGNSRQRLHRGHQPHVMDILERE